MNVYDLRAAAALSDAAYYNQASEMDERIAPFGWSLHDDINRGSNRALICYNDILKAVAVVFRGSTTRQNWLVNLDARAVRGVHRGFSEAYDELNHEVAARLEVLLEHGEYRTILVTGHSLGGALACLCAFGLRDPHRLDVRVITFGQPRVGDYGWARMYDVFVPNTVRVVHDLDDVPLLPGYPFKHIGRLLHLNSQGVPLAPPGRWWRRLLQWVRGVLAYPKSGLTDHLLPSYINSIKKVNPSWSTND